MTKLFSEVSDPQQEKISGGVAASIPFEGLPGSSMSPPASTSTPILNQSQPAYPLSSNDPRNNTTTCPACGMG